MKSLITLFLNGKLVDSPKEEFKLIVWINDHKHEIAKISQQIALWDKYPFVYQCKIRISLYNCTNLNKGLLGGRKETEEMPLVAEHRFAFIRYLNDKIRLYPKVEFPKYGNDPQLINHSVECSTSGFPLLRINPLLMESCLSSVIVEDIGYPIDLSRFFEDFNCKQIRDSQSNLRPIVYLLRINNIVNTGVGGKLVIYYQSYVTKTDKFTLIDDQKINIEEPAKTEKDSKEIHSPRQVDLLTFDDWE